jgi:hypothetical protein
MDTLKDKQLFDEMHARGERPWEVWKGGARIAPGEPAPYRGNGDVERMQVISRVTGGAD